MRFVRSYGVGFVLLTLMTSASRTHAQQNPKLTTVNYGNIVITATNWPFLIAEQEGMFQKERIDFKRVIGGNTTATTQALVAGSTDFAQMNLSLARSLISHRISSPLHPASAPWGSRRITSTTFSTRSPERAGIGRKKINPW